MTLSTTTISGRPSAAVPLTGTELVVIDQGTGTVKAPVSAIAALAPPGADGDGTAYYGQISRQTTGTVAVAAANTYYPIDLPGVFDAANSYGMVTGTTEDLALKNDSGETQLFTVIGSADVRSSNNQVLGLRLAVNGTPIAASECRVTTGSTNYGKLLSQWIVELDDGQEVSLHVANFNNTTTIQVDRAKLVAFTAGRQGESGAVAFGTITYSATVNLDMSVRNGQVSLIELTGGLTLTASNLALGRTTGLLLDPGASSRSIAFPAGWRFVSTKPASIPAGKLARLSLECWGSTEAEAVARIDIEP